MTRRGAVQERPDGVNSLAVPTDHTSHVVLTKLHLKDNRFAAWHFGQDHVIRKFNQLPNYELKKLSHFRIKLNMNRPTHKATARQVDPMDTKFTP